MRPVKCMFWHTQLWYPGYWISLCFLGLLYFSLCPYKHPLALIKAGECLPSVQGSALSKIRESNSPTGRADVRMPRVVDWLFLSFFFLTFLKNGLGSDTKPSISLMHSPNTNKHRSILHGHTNNGESTGELTSIHHQGQLQFNSVSKVHMPSACEVGERSPLWGGYLKTQTKLSYTKNPKQSKRVDKMSRLAVQA